MTIHRIVHIKRRIINDSKTVELDCSLAMHSPALSLLTILTVLYSTGYTLKIAPNSADYLTPKADTAAQADTSEAASNAKAAVNPLLRTAEPGRRGKDKCRVSNRPASCQHGKELKSAVDTADQLENNPRKRNQDGDENSPRKAEPARRGKISTRSTKQPTANHT